MSNKIQNTTAVIFLRNKNFDVYITISFYTQRIVGNRGHFKHESTKDIRKVSIIMNAFRNFALHKLGIINADSETLHNLLCIFCSNRLRFGNFSACSQHESHSKCQQYSNKFPHINILLKFVLRNLFLEERCSKYIRAPFISKR